MTYTLIQNSENLFDILENKTDTNIVMNETRDYVEDLITILNSGSGFNGSTPTFFATFNGMKLSEINSSESE